MTSDDEVMAFIEHMQMEETRSYVERGRTLTDFGNEEVLDIWVAFIESGFVTALIQTCARWMTPTRNLDFGGCQDLRTGLAPSWSN